MKPRLTVITIGVDDLEESRRFYRDGLGLSAEGIIGKEFEYGAVVFIDLQPGLRLALWPRKSIARDSGLELGGYAGCFQDPDGHLWEIVWNPQWNAQD